MRISDWSSDVCSSDLNTAARRLTTARYYTPSGRSVQEGGIEPDIRVPQISDPDYKTRPRFRESDLRRHLINEAKVDNSILEDDNKEDPRFKATAEELKKQGIEDFRSEEHTSELQSLMRISYAVFCLKKKKTVTTQA